MTNLETGRLSDRHPPYRYAALSRVSFSDTDAQGVVYYGRYLPYFDNARLEYLRHLGLTGFWHGSREFAMRALEVTYEAPAQFDDLLEVYVRTTRIGRTSVTSEGAAYRVDDDRLMCTMRMTVVLIDAATRRTLPVPDDYRRTIVAFEGADVDFRGKPTGLSPDRRVGWPARRPGDARHPGRDPAGTVGHRLRQVPGRSRTGPSALPAPPIRPGPLGLPALAAPEDAGSRSLHGRLSLEGLSRPALGRGAERRSRAAGPTTGRRRSGCGGTAVRRPARQPAG